MEFYEFRSRDFEFELKFYISPIKVKIHLKSAFAKLGNEFVNLNLEIKNKINGSNPTVRHLTKK